MDAQDQKPADPAAETGAELAPVASAVPRPADVSEIEEQELRARAAGLVANLETAAGSKEMELADGISSVGLQSQRQASSNLQLLRTRMGDVLSKESAGTQIARDLGELRANLERINPNEGNRTGAGKLLDLVPFHKSLIERLERIAMRYETVSSQTVVIEKRLREGQQLLQRDNGELRKLYEQVESQQQAVKKNAYLGELLIDELQKAVTRTTDPQKSERLRAVLFDVSSRVQDLRTMEEVHNQFFTSITLTRENNVRLAQSVDRTLSLASNTIMVGLAIQAALANQRRVLEATRRTREFLGDLIAQNATAINQYTNEIGDIYKTPVIAIEKLTQAHDELIAALDAADNLETTGIEIARDNIQRLRTLSSQLEARLVQETPPPASSIEA